MRLYESGRSPWVLVPRALYKMGITRGPGRFMKTLAKIARPLRMLPVRVADGRVLHLDLREIQNLPFLLVGRMPFEHFEGVFMSSVVREGETVFDVGANVGWYSTLLAQAVGPTGRVFAFEPGRAPRRMLTETVRAYPQIEIVPKGVSDHEGDATLFTPTHLAGASIHRTEGCVSMEQCRLTTLDAFWKSAGCPDVSFIKLDIEGAEPDALKRRVTTSREQETAHVVDRNAIQFCENM